MAKEKFSALVEIKGGVATSFNASVADSVSAVGRLKKELGGLSKTQSQMKRFSEGGKRVGELTDKLNVARKDLERLQQEFAKTPHASAKMVGGLERAKSQVQKLEGSLKNEKLTLERVGVALRAAGVDTSRLAKEQGRLEERAKAAAGAIRKQDYARAKFGEAKTGLRRWGMASAAVAGVGAGMLKPVKDAADYQQTEIDFSKFVAGAETAEGLKLVSDEVLKIGSKSLLGAAGVGQLVNGFGKIGFAAKDALDAAKATDTLAIGLDMTADEASTLITKIMTGMKLGVKETLELGDAVNYIGDVTAADAKRTAEIMQRQGALIKATTTLTNDQIVSLAASFDMAAPNAESGATAMKNFMRGLSRGIGTSKMGYKAWGLLGLDPRTISAEMQKDAVGTMSKVLRKIAQVAGKDRDFALSRIFGEESKGSVGYWLSNVDGFEENMHRLDDRTKFLGRSVQEQARQLSGLNAKWIVFKNHMKVISILTGKNLLPHVTKFLDKASGVLTRFTDWIKENPDSFKRLTEMAGAMFLVAAGVVGVGASLAAVKVVMTGLNFGLAALQVKWLAAAFTGAGGVISTVFLPVLGKVGVVLGAVFSPIGLVVAAVVALGVAIWKYWEPLTAFFKGFWDGFLEGVEPGLDALGDLWRRFDEATGAGKFFSEAWGGVVKVLTDDWEAVKGWFVPIEKGSKVTKDAAKAGKAWGVELGWLATKGLFKLVEGLGKLIDFLPRLKVRAVEVFGSVKRVVSDNINSILGVVMMALGPVTLAFGGIFLMVRKYWEPIKAFFASFGEGFMRVMQPVGGVLKEIWAALGPVFVSVGGLIKAFWELAPPCIGIRFIFAAIGKVFGWVYRKLKEFFTPLSETSEQVGKASEAGKVFGEILGVVIVGGLTVLKEILVALPGLIDGFKNGMVSAFTEIKNFCQPVLDALMTGLEWFDGDKKVDVQVSEHVAIKPSLLPSSAVAGGGKSVATNHNSFTFKIDGSRSPEETARAVDSRMREFFAQGGASMMDEPVMMMS